MSEYKIPLKIDVLDGGVQQIFTPAESDYGTLGGLYSLRGANAVTIRLDPADGGVRVGYIDGEMVLDGYGKCSWANWQWRRKFGDIQEGNYFEEIVAEAKRDGSTLVVEPVNNPYDWMLISGLGSLLEHVCKTHVGNGMEYIDFSALDDSVFGHFVDGGEFRADDGREIEISPALRKYNGKSQTDKVVDVTDRFTPSSFDWRALKIAVIGDEDSGNTPCKGCEGLEGYVRVHDCKVTSGWAPMTQSDSPNYPVRKQL